MFSSFNMIEKLSFESSLNSKTKDDKSLGFYNYVIKVPLSNIFLKLRKPMDFLMDKKIKQRVYKQSTELLYIMVIK